MTLKWLTASRAIWLAREKYRYRKWLHYRDEQPERLDLRKKWYDLYAEAHTQRIRRDRQIAAAKVPSKVSDAGVAFIAGFEGFREKAYRDLGGVWTVGYGETEHVNANTTMTQKAALGHLRTRLNRDYVPAVLAAAKDHPLTQNQLDAMASFVYNVGVGGVGPSTQVGRNLRLGNKQAAADALLAWNKVSGKPIEGLTRRRQAERSLFL